MNVYKITMHVKCTKDDAAFLQEILAQTVYDELELGSVFNVSVEPDNLIE
jgi:hypothetical protein